MRIEANNIHNNYELSGKEDSPVVMLSHSLACSLVMWNPQMDILQSHFRVLRYDTRGHGASDAPEGAYTLDMLGKDALALLDALEIETVHFVGLSMGGMIGQCLALHHKDRIKSLTPDEAQPIWDERIAAVRNEGMQTLVQETLERWFTQPYLKLNPPEVELIRSQVISTPVAGFIGCCEAIRRLDYLKHLSELTLPTLIIVGEEDPGTPVAASEAMQAQIEGSKLVVLPSAAHLSNIEQAEDFNKALIDFLPKQ